MAPLTKKSPDYQALENSDSESENISVARASTPVKTKATTSKKTPVNSRNMVTGVVDDSTNQPTTKKPKQQRSQSEQAKNLLTTTRPLFASQLQTFQPSNMLPMP